MSFIRAILRLFRLDQLILISKLVEDRSEDALQELYTTVTAPNEQKHRGILDAQTNQEKRLDRSRRDRLFCHALGPEQTSQKVARSL
jgi:hypothetical protein